jgi:hypothetical protein
MWLDRLSGNPTPSGSPPQSNSRSFSPNPRSSSSLAPPYRAQRPGFSPRVSSLSLVSNESSTSLLGGSRKPNGSGLKQSSIPADDREPLDVLERILGSEIKEETHSQHVEGRVLGNDVDARDWEELDFGGLSLRQLAGQETSRKDVPDAYRPQTVDECRYPLRYTAPMLIHCVIDERDKAKFDDLHRSIRACDDVLNSVEENLASFQNDLGAVSAEIETLQARSTALSLRLENRKLVEKGLGPIVEEITVSPAVVRKISEGVIDEGWVKALAEVEKRSKALSMKSKERRNIKGISDLRPLLDHLVNKVSHTLEANTYLLLIGSI